MDEQIPHYYFPTNPYKGCGLCGYGPGALVHNKYEVARYLDAEIAPETEYSRCHNCGDYFEVTPETGWTVCSDACFKEYREYLMDRPY